MKEEFKKKFKEKFIFNLGKKEFLGNIPEEIKEEFVNLSISLAEQKMPFLIEETEEITEIVLKKIKDNVEDKVTNIISRVMALSNKFSKIKEKLNYDFKAMAKWQENIDILKNEINIEVLNIKKHAIKEVFTDDIFDNGTFINIDKSFKKMLIPQIELKLEYSWAYFCYFHLELLKLANVQLDFFEKTIAYYCELEKLYQVNNYYEQIDRTNVEECLKESKKYDGENKLDSNFYSLCEYCETQIKLLLDLQSEIIDDKEIHEIEKKDLQLLISNFELVNFILNLTKITQFRYNYEFNYTEFLDEIRKEVECIDNLLMSLIKEGESITLEFKSSLIHDYKKNIKNIEITEVIAKEITAFMNTNGGRLLIGVNDNGEILGIEKDFQYVLKNNSDGFLLRLDDLIKDKIGLGLSSFIETKLVEIEEKLVCFIDIKKSNKDVFYNGEDFYIRLGASMRKLTTKEYTNYRRQ